MFYTQKIQAAQLLRLRKNYNFRLLGWHKNNLFNATSEAADLFHKTVRAATIPYKKRRNWIEKTRQYRSSLHAVLSRWICKFLKRLKCAVWCIYNKKYFNSLVNVVWLFGLEMFQLWKCNELGEVDETIENSIWK